MLDEFINDLKRNYNANPNVKLELNNNKLQAVTGSSHGTSVSSIDLSELTSSSGKVNQSLSLQNGILNLSGANSVDLSGIIASFIDTDQQRISFSSNNVLSISNGNSVDLSTLLDNTDLLASLTCNTGESISYTSGIGWVCIAPGALNNNQALGLIGNTLSITNGGSVDLSNYLDNTDSQALSLNGTVLSISGNANTVDLSALFDNTDNQALSWDDGTRTLSLTNGGMAVIPDANTTYGAGSGLNLSGTTFSLSNSGVAPSSYNFVTVDASGRITNATTVGYLTTEQDGVVGNEISDVTAASGLIRTGAGTTESPYKVSLMTSCASGELIKWDELFPKDDSPEEQQKWQSFVDQWPPHMQSNLEELLVVDAELREQTRDLDIMRGVTEIRAERLEVMRAASGYVGAERTLQKLSGQAAMVRSRAALTNRGLTRADRKQLEHIGEQQTAAEARKNSIVTSPDIVAEIQRRREIKDSRDLQKGILLTEQMQDTIDYVLPSLAAGRPVLLVGETGGAKTALAEFISTEYFDKVPEIISGNTDVNSYQLMGKMRLRPADSWTDEDLKEAMDQIIKEDQYDHVTPEIQARVRTKAIERVLARSGSVSDFIPGPVIRAMEEGKPLILDEVNAIQPEFIKRLNKIMQLRPGQTYIPQEDSGRSVVVKPGFCIIATANEKSKRYKGVDDLSVELLNRFGANIVRVPYPDGKVPDGQPPKDNLRLALAFLRDRSGVIDPDIDLAEVALFVKAAHVTQKLFTGSEVPSYINTTTVRDGLKDAVIAPRTMVDILAKVKEGHSLNDTLSHFVSGLKNESDRQAIKEILEQHNFEIGTAQEA